MANRMFQNIIHQMRDAVGRVIGVMDENGTVIACSDLSQIGSVREDAANELVYAGDAVLINGTYYKPFGVQSRFDYAVFVEGSDELALSYTGVLTVALSNLKQYFDEKYDKSNFVKNVILDNILPGDIYYKAKELRFDCEVPRVAYLVRTAERSELSLYDIMLSLFPERNRDFVINVTETDIAVIRELRSEEEQKELEKVGGQISDTLSGEFYTKCHIGIGTVVENVKDLARSFKEAQIALDVGKVFESEKNIIRYNKLGIARLIYQLPTTLCNMFISEVFQQGSINSLDFETLLTIQKFFENNLNVSETARKLFVHRNTLVYRLEKIRKLTGLDIREFDNAVIFKVALMVNRYMTESED